MISQDQQSRVFYELCALLLSILRPPPLSVSVSPPPSPATAPPRRSEISPSALASLLLGVSMALMLCGSVTFVIGFILMPWVLGLVMIFYFFGLVSNLSGLGKAILLGNNSTGSERNEMPGESSHQAAAGFETCHAKPTVIKGNFYPNCRFFKEQARYIVLDSGGESVFILIPMPIQVITTIFNIYGFCFVLFPDIHFKPVNSSCL